MANISITNLQPAGSALFSDSESFVDSMQDLSENELKMTFGGSGHGSKKKSKSKNKSKSKGSGHGGCGCGYGC
jgi:hypothetical protein